MVFLGSKQPTDCPSCVYDRRVDEMFLWFKTFFSSDSSVILAVNVDVKTAVEDTRHN